MSGNAHIGGQGKRSPSPNPSSMADFEAAWKELRPLILALLVRRGTPQDVAEDVAQDTAIRLLTNWHLLEEGRPVWPFVRRIALNCLVDRHRRERFDPLDVVADRSDPHDVEEQSLARFRLRAVWRAMSGLSHRDRTILLAEVGMANNCPNDSATKMARRRARQKLTAAVERSGAFSGIPVAWRRFTAWLQVNVPATHLEVGTAAGLVVIMSAAAVTLGQAGEPERKPQTTTLRATQVSEVRASTGRSSGASEVAEPKRDQHAAALSGKPSDPAKAASSRPSSSDPASASASTVPARAETGQNGGATYVKVCTGEGTQTPYDDVEVTIVVYDGDQEPGDDAPECRHKNEEQEGEEP